MGLIVLEGDPPYEPIYAQSAATAPTQDGVELIINVHVGEQGGETVAIRILLKPEDATALAPQLSMNARIVQRWRGT